MSAVSVPVARTVASSRVTGGLLLATLFCVTFEKVHWNLGGDLGVADVLTVLFLLAFALTSRGPVPRTTAIVLAFFAAFLLVYLLGFFNIETKQSLDQFTKGMVKFVLHFLFLAASVSYLVQRGRRFYWRSLGWFTAGLVANCVYGVLQLLSAKAGHNLDKTVLSPLTGGASSINVYGSVGGSSVYRPNALTGDPNHLGIMLIVPLLVLLPVYLRLERGHPPEEVARASRSASCSSCCSRRSRAAACSASASACSCSRCRTGGSSGRARCSRRSRPSRFCSRTFSTRGGTTSRWCLRSRVQTGGASSSAHFAVYDFIPQIIHSHPLLGLGLNTFSVYYEFVTGKTNWGPHSFWVALIVETGLVGLLLFCVFLRYVYLRLRAARLLGRHLAASMRGVCDPSDGG